ncbi:MAG: Lrp/AsnC family transcriptional regulator [Candidatus Hydrothermarchaeota archaeon]
MPELGPADRLAPGLNRKKAITLLKVLEDGRVADSDLMGALGLRSANSASYYRKDLEEQGIIKGYTAVIDWRKLGYSTEFLVLMEGRDMESNFNLEKELVASLEDYAKENGDVFILPSGNGRVVVSSIITCFGERPMTVLLGHATSEQDAIVFSRYYIAEKFTDARTTFLLVKGKGVDNYRIQKDYIAFMKGSFTEKGLLELPAEFRKRFPSLAASKGKR